MSDPNTRITQLLSSIYEEESARQTWQALAARLDAFRARHPRLAEEATRPVTERLTERDAIVITYGDQISEPGRSPLQTLASFLDRHLSGAIRGIQCL